MPFPFAARQARPVETLLALLTLPALAGGPKSLLQSSGDWEWSISSGPSIRNVGMLQVNAGYRSTAAMVPSFVGNDSQTMPPIGEEDAFADRFYDDGFVRRDAATAADGTTWFWGYDNASQVQGDQLSYSATGAQSTRRDSYSRRTFRPLSRDSLRGFSPHIQVDARSPHRVAGFRLGLSAAFDFTQVDQTSSFVGLTGTQFRDDYRIDYVDRFDLGGVIPPRAPYAGSLGGPGPVIPNRPASRSVTPVLVSTDTASITNQVRNSIDIDVFSLTFGPTLQRRWGPLDFSVQAGLILNVYQWQGRQTETLSATNSSGTTEVARWAEGDSGTKFRPGLYTQGEVSYDVDEQIAIGLWLRVDTAREFRAQAGPSIYRIDPTGFSTGFAITYKLP
jgi:hypothetical protein